MLLKNMLLKKAVAKKCNIPRTRYYNGILNIFGGKILVKQKSKFRGGKWIIIQILEKKVLVKILKNWLQIEILAKDRNFRRKSQLCNRPKKIPFIVEFYYSNVLQFL